jgi:hypothetical protein
LNTGCVFFSLQKTWKKLGKNITFATQKNKYSIFLKAMTILRQIILLSTILVFLNSIKTYSQSAESTIYWTPGYGENGCDATITMRIKYGTLLGEPTQLAVMKIVKGENIYYNGKIYSISDVGEEAYKSIRFSSVDLTADIYDGGYYVDNVLFKNVIEFDVAGSPRWGEVFNRLTAEEEKALFRKGFEIRNLTVSNFGVSQYSMDDIKRAIEKKEKIENATNVLTRVRSLANSDYIGDLEKANELLKEIRYQSEIKEKYGEEINNLSIKVAEKLKNSTRKKELQDKLSEASRALISKNTKDYSVYRSALEEVLNDYISDNEMKKEAEDCLNRLKKMEAQQADIKEDAIEEKKTTSGSEKSVEKSMEKDQSTNEQPSQTNQIKQIEASTLSPEMIDFMKSPYYNYYDNPDKKALAFQNYRIKKVVDEAANQAYSDISRMIIANQISAQRNREHREKMDELTQINPYISNPSVLLDDYNQKKSEIKKQLDKKRDEDIKQNNQAYYYELSKCKNDFEKSALNLVYYLSENSGEKKIKKEYKDAVDELEEDFKRKMTSLKNTFVADNRSASTNYYNGAIIAFYESDEDAYYNRYLYHTCVADYAENQFVNTSDKWIYNNCFQPQPIKFIGNPSNPSAEETLEAAKRKNKKYLLYRDEKFKNTAISFVNFAIEKNPNYAEAYMFRSQYGDLVESFKDIRVAYLLKPEKYSLEYKTIQKKIAADFINAIANNQLQLAEKIITQKLYFSFWDELSVSPYDLAIEKNNSKILELLIESNINKNEYINKTGNYYLLYSITKASHNCLDLLIQKYAVDVNYIDENKISPLIYAIGINNDFITTKLLAANADTEYAFNYFAKKDPLKTDKLTTLLIENTYSERPFIKNIEYLESRKKYISSSTFAKLNNRLSYS